MRNHPGEVRQLPALTYLRWVPLCFCGPALTHALVQVPIVFVDRIYGASKLGSAEIVMYLRGLAALFLTT